MNVADAKLTLEVAELQRKRAEHDRRYGRQAATRSRPIDRAEFERRLAAGKLNRRNVAVAGTLENRIAKSLGIAPDTATRQAATIESWKGA